MPVGALRDRSSRELPVRLLAQCHPELARDISQWVRAQPVTRPPEIGRVARIVQKGNNDFLMNCLSPSAALDYLAELGPDRRLVHLFAQVSDLLIFLAQSDALRCAQRPEWIPLVLLPLIDGSHLRQWLSRTAPGDWPWNLLQEGVSDDATAQALQRLDEQMTRIVRDLCTQRSAQLVAKYANRPTPADIIAGRQRPLRVLTFAAQTSVYQQYCARDIADGLRVNGVQAEASILMPSPAMGYELLDRLLGFDPDVLFLNGTHRGSLTSILDALPPNLCVLSWDQDYAVAPADDYLSNCGPRDRLMVMVREWRADAALRGIEIDRVSHLNLGSNTRIYYPPAQAVESEYDVLFVGNIHPFESYRHIIGFDRLDENMQKLLLRSRERLIEWVNSRSENETHVLPDCDQFLRQTLVEMNLAPSGDQRKWRFTVNYFRYRIAHLTVRQLYLESLTEFRLGLFGRGWESFETLARFAMPPLDNGDPLREAIHRSAINLHLHTWTVHHPRLYDTAAAGGFLLVGRVGEDYPIDKVFTVGKELDCFGSIAELKTKIRYYLAHPQERQTMAAAAAERAWHSHSIDLRMADAIRWLGDEKTTCRRATGSRAA